MEVLKKRGNLWEKKITISFFKDASKNDISNRNSKRKYNQCWHYVERMIGVDVRFFWHPNFWSP